MIMNNDKDATLQRLEDALKRLKRGDPERTKADGKISIKRINDEAGLSRGAIYYYKEFVRKAKAEIAVFNEDSRKSAAIDKIEANETTETKLRKERDSEKRLKNDYREQLNSYKLLTDEVVKENVSLAFRCMELQDEINMLHDRKVTRIGEKKV
jgi:predicted transcriptional regulator